MKDIIELAKQAGLYVGTNLSGVTLVGAAKSNGLLIHLTVDDLASFAALVRAEDEALLRKALAQLEINRTNFRKGPSKSICKMLAGGNDDIIAALRERLGEKT